MAGDSSTLTIGNRIPEESAYLIVFDESGSRRVPLPRATTWEIGRAEGCGIQLADASASRRHAAIAVAADGTITVSDLGSHNGTRVNERGIDRPRQLAAADVIGVGRSVLVLHLPAPRAPGDALDARQAQQRLERELARARRHGRPLTVLLVELGGGDGGSAVGLCDQTLRPEDAIGTLDDETLIFLLPEASPAEVQRVVAELPRAIAVAAPTARIVAATYPADGADTGALLAAARARLRGTSDTITVGDRKVIAADPAMVQTYELLRRLARSDLSVLIAGETGAGKEMAAYALHAWSPRAAGPFVPVNCASLPETLAESELFGYERGAFSGADRAKPGLIERAGGGTLFLDEIGELPAAVQAKLLRTLEERSVMRLGAAAPAAVDFRLVAATNRNVAGEVGAGRFRQDLYYRIAAATVEVPPLRDRPRDLAVLARAFLARACARLERTAASLSDGALRALAGHRFPGNVRELANAMEYAAATCGEEVVEAWHLPATVRAEAREAADEAPAGEPGAGLADAPTPPITPAAPAPGADLPAFRAVADEIADLERRRMTEALAVSGGNQSKAAELIGMPRRTFVTKVVRYGLRVTEE